MITVDSPVNPDIVLEENGAFLFSTAIERESAAIDFTSYFDGVDFYLKDGDRIEYEIPDGDCGPLAWRILDPDNGDAVVDASTFLWTDKEL